MYLVVSKLKDFVVQDSDDNVFSFCNIKTVILHQMIRRYHVIFHWLYLVQLVTNSDSQISEVVLFFVVVFFFFFFL